MTLDLSVIDRSTIEIDIESLPTMRNNVTLVDSAIFIPDKRRLPKSNLHVVGPSGNSNLAIGVENVKSKRTILHVVELHFSPSVLVVDASNNNKSKTSWQLNILDEQERMQD